MPRCPLVVGRTGASAVLARALDATRAGSGRLVVVTAPPGLGKSRLAGEAAARAAAGDGASALRACAACFAGKLG